MAITASASRNSSGTSVQYPNPDLARAVAGHHGVRQQLTRLVRALVGIAGGGGRVRRGRGGRQRRRGDRIAGKAVRSGGSTESEQPDQ
ncbi:hypothetical protein [Haloechinothrix alba]|uniref:hypothetical protein n=1 Tax=Haloechinothrix alba TaxID=664784 RepID=UPI000B76BAB4|nr:hypothetical protein [Haloechinothrix alba]